MKILFHNHTGKVSGAERVLLMILEKLDRERFDPVVLCPADGPLIEKVNGLGIRTVTIDSLAARFTWRPDRLIRYFGSFVRTILQARAMVKREAPDLIHANSIRAALVMSSATIGTRLPIIWHVHDLLPPHLLSTAIRLFAVLSSRNRILAVSRAVAERFRGRLLCLTPGRVPLKVIHNAVDLKRFHPAATDREELPREFGCSQTDLMVGLVGQLTPRKGQLELIEAFAAVSRLLPRVKLVFAGEAMFNRDHKYAESLYNAAQELEIGGHVKFLGHCENVPALMRALDLLVVNSHVEPFGLTVVEAMASGTAVLATAVDGIKEIIDHERDGWLVGNGDQMALVDALLKLLCNDRLRARLAAEGMNKVRSAFSDVRFLNEMSLLYQSTIESSPRARYEKVPPALHTKLTPD